MERSYRKIAITPDSLLGCRFFDDVERDERARILRYCEGRRYHAGREIIRHDDDSRDVFFIVAGAVQATLLTAAGKVVTFQELYAGDMFGELSAIDSAPRSTSVVAVVDTTLIRISGSNFKALVAGSPILADRTMLRLCELCRYLCERAFQSRAYSIPDQILIEIYRLVSARPTAGASLRIEPTPTHKDIAARVGTTREQVTRVMSSLSKRGLVTQERMSWTVPDVKALREEVRHHLDGDE